ncbi:MAG: hypothetical protein JNM38_22510 [Acidobacteria bacterium]|jgi:hypothetical protein|nr:hypothetical protein [Acidobacteriota bacterium]
MTVHILVREDQNDHGFVDTSIVGVYSSKTRAEAVKTAEEVSARADGLVVEDDDSPGGDWQVSWKVWTHEVDMSPDHPRVR